MKEYERLITHYEEIWKVGSTILSYMAVASAGLLAFGDKRLNLEGSLFLAGLPLALWYIGIYWPSQLYTFKVLERLKAVEDILAARGSTSTGHFSGWYREITTATFLGGRLTTGSLFVHIPFLVLTLITLGLGLCSAYYYWFGWSLLNYFQYNRGG